MERSTRLFTRFAVTAVSMSMMVAIFAGTAYASAATNITKGQGPGDVAPTATPAYAWAGSNFYVDLSITTDATSNVKQYALIFNGPGVCTLSDADTVLVTGAGECVVAGRVNSGNTYSASTDEMEISISKGTQATLTAVATPSSAVYNETVDLSTTGGTTGGSVTYTKQSGDCSVNSGAATATVTALSSPAADCVVRATMAGNSNYEAVVDDVTITVSKASQEELQVLTDLNDGTTATYVSPNGEVALSYLGGSGTGGVTYSKVSGDCTVTASTATITGGTNNCVVRATRAADDNYLQRTDDATITVGKADQAALTVLTDTTDGVAKKYGESAALTNTGGTTGGVVTYSHVSGNCAVNNGAATATVTALESPPVNCVVRATMAGNGNYNNVIDDVTITVGKADQASLTLLTAGTDGVAKKYGESAALTASGGTTAGVVTYSVTSGDCEITGLTNATVTTLAGSADNCVIRATMAGGNSYNDVYDEATITVGKADQAVLTLKTNGINGTTAAFGEAVALTTTGGSSAGAVTFVKVGVGDCDVDNTADTATVTTLAGSVDNCVVEVTMAGGENYNDVTSSTATITVGKATQATFAALAGGTDGTNAYLTTVALSYSGGSVTGTVTYAKVSGDCTVNNGAATATTTGTTNNCIVEATSPANDNYFVTTDRVTIIVSGATQATFTALASGFDALSVTSSDSTLIALSSSGGSGGGAVTFTKISGDCTVVGSTATITGYTNNCVVEATSAANGGYAVATDRVTITVSSVSLPTTSVSPTARKAGRNATVTNSGTWAANGGTLSAASYQWYQCTSPKSAVAAASAISAPGDCVLIDGATTSTWRIQGLNRRYLRVLVTRSNEAGSAYAWSATFRR